MNDAYSDLIDASTTASITLSRLRLKIADAERDAACSEIDQVRGVLNKAIAAAKKQLASQQSPVSGVVIRVNGKLWKPS